ncbi:MAG: AAA family ATPase [Thermodesulfobacteriota bacterium]|nr:AAA family ATPase [Thermodesulfobacteriota bacterium]
MNSRTIMTADACLDFFGLTANPFPLAPDSSHMYISGHIDAIIREIAHGMIARKGFFVLAGDIGLGKTTISRHIIEILETNGVATSLVLNTAYQNEALLHEINNDFGIQTGGDGSEDPVRVLYRFIADRNAEGRNCAIVVDDAQNLSPESLEYIRLIANFEAGGQKLVQVLLVGQYGLLKNLDIPSLRQLKSRIYIKKEARPLSRKELGRYIQFKLHSAGGNDMLRFTRSAIHCIYRLTKGNFRKVNILADRCLYAAFAHGTLKIVVRHVREAYHDVPDRRSLWLARPDMMPLAALLLVAMLFAGHYSGAFNRASSFVQAAVNIKWLPGVAAIRRPMQTDRLSKRPYRETGVGYGYSERVGIAGTRQNETHPPWDGVDDPKPGSAMQGNHILPTGTPDMMNPSSANEIAVADVPALRHTVDQFLGFYQVRGQTERLVNALQTDTTDSVTSQILRETGYALLSFDVLPARVWNRYAILEYPVTGAGKTSHYLLWRPELTVAQFYYGYRSDAIRRLQVLLAEQGFYRRGIDDIVGKHLMKAIVEFQQANGIDITGYPDPQTIFMLYSYRR